MQLVDSIVEATDAAFLNADFVTSTGSIIPALNIFTALPVLASIPQSLRSTTSTNNPAFCNITL